MTDLRAAWKRHETINEQINKENILHSRLRAVADNLSDIDRKEIEDLDFLKEQLYEEGYIQREMDWEPLSLLGELESRTENAKKYMEEVVAQKQPISQMRVQTLETAYVTFREDERKVIDEVKQGFAKMLLDDFTKDLCFVEDEIINGFGSLSEDDTKKRIVELAFGTIYSEKPDCLGYFGEPLKYQREDFREVILSDTAHRVFADIPDSIIKLSKVADPEHDSAEAAVAINKVKDVVNLARKYREKYEYKPYFLDFNDMIEEADIPYPLHRLSLDEAIETAKKVIMESKVDLCTCAVMFERDEEPDIMGWIHYNSAFDKEPRWEEAGEKEGEWEYAERDY